MRCFLVVGTLLLGSAAGAQDAAAPAQPPPPAPPLKLMAIMLDSQQVLLWNETADEYELARVGDEVESWRVVKVMPEAKRVVVARAGVRDELTLLALPRPNAGQDPRLPRMAPMIVVDNCPAAAPPVAGQAQGQAGPVPVSQGVDGQPMNPYAAPPPATRGGPAPMNPYGAQVPQGPPAPLPAPQPLAPQLQQPPPDQGAPPPAPSVESHVLTRAEMNRELRDFDRLLAGITVGPANGGGFVLTRVEPKSWVAKIGLRQGDVVRSVAGETVTTIEDAARVYAKLGSLDSFLVMVERSGQKLVLSYTVK